MGIDAEQGNWVQGDGVPEYKSTRYWVQGVGTWDEDIRYSGLSFM